MLELLHYMVIDAKQSVTIYPTISYTRNHSKIQQSPEGTLTFHNENKLVNKI